MGEVSKDNFDAEAGENIDPNGLAVASTPDMVLVELKRGGAWPDRSEPPAVALTDCNSAYSTGCGYGEATSCNGNYEVHWPIEFYVNLDTNGNPVRQECGLIGPQVLYLETGETSARGKDSADADCVSGSGSFYLAPVRGLDNDRDGKLHVSLLPVQVSGTGTMTRRASVSSITPTSTLPAPALRVLKPTDLYQFQGDDTLADAGTKSILVTGPIQPAAGTILGSPTFTLDDAAASEWSGLMVDMVWSCDATTPTLTRPVGYQLKLADVGCGAVQKFTLRYQTGPGRVTLEPYGNPNLAVVEPTTETSAGHAFIFEKGDLYVDGAIVSVSPQSMVMQLIEVRWKGAAVCTPGTYSLARE